MEKKIKISKRRIQEIIKEEVYKVLQELGIPDLTPKSFNSAIKSASKGQEPISQPEPEKRVSSPADLRRKWSNRSKEEPLDISNREAETVSDLEDAAIKAALVQDISTGAIKGKIDQVIDLVDDTVESEPEEDSSYEL